MSANFTEGSATSTGGLTSASMTSADNGTSSPSPISTDPPPIETPEMTCPLPSNSTTSGDDGSADVPYGSTPAFVIYTHRTSGNAPVLPLAADMKGYTVVYRSRISHDIGARHAIKEDYNSAGISVIVSAFGATNVPTPHDPVDTANTMAQWVLDHELDGIDVDYEDFAGMKLGDGKTEKWVITFTQTLRQKLPKGHYLLTHAPVAPWLSAAWSSSGGYLTVDEEVGSLIDWYNVQFYNQGPGMYETCDGLLNTAGTQFPGSALNEIASAGVPLNKLVIGKIANTTDGNNGCIAPQTLAQCFALLQMLESCFGRYVIYPDADAKMIQTVRGPAFPL
ncbi:glycoside hydrolase family 18 protein [Trametes coccinea BRFM310]|uniref:Glycoside hydrolase family 18 protein n=1 Tax=Trametes coccinea (strain BRFM310) TaxID=1353009 RepID=A0A1Y2J043_TRAC3|nr:glycoside hydrolase family 18 protein [Trametes coccinea BRFM310]